MAAAPRTATSGSIDRLPSARYRSRFTRPDGKVYSARTEADRPLTFTTKGDAQRYLAAQQTAISAGTWKPPGHAAAAPNTLRAYADAWLETRPLAVRSREHYRSLLDHHVLPT